jgi:hypothetical protein
MSSVDEALLLDKLQHGALEFQLRMTTYMYGEHPNLSQTN